MGTHPPPRSLRPGHHDPLTTQSARLCRAFPACFSTRRHAPPCTTLHSVQTMHDLMSQHRLVWWDQARK